jgi:hypothetical protein
VFKDNVKAVPVDFLLYFCPYKVNELTSHQRDLFISTNQRLPFKSGDVITSAQSDGIMHRIEQIKMKDQLNYILGKPIGLIELVKYADFSQTVDIEELMHPLTQEQIPGPELLQKVIADKSSKNNIHIIDHDVNVFYKCTGHLYEIGGKSVGMTYYLVTKNHSSIYQYQVDDIILAETTGGFLENVINITKGDSGVYLQTNLTNCNPGMLNDLQLELNLDKPSFMCYGGNGYPGLLYYNKTSLSDSLIGTTIIGRNSSAVLAKIIDIVYTPDYVFYEVTDVDFEDNGHLVVSADPAVLTTDRRRTRRQAATFSKNVAKTLNYTVINNNNFY